MGKVILTDTEKETSGFYYDLHRKNPMMRVTLHANTKIPDSAFEQWPAWATTGLIDVDEPEAGNSKIKYVINDQTEEVDIRYGARPICSSIINEDFNVSVANTWADFAGGQQINDLFNTYKTFEAYSHKIAPMLKTLSSGARDYVGENSDSIFNNKIGLGAVKAVDVLGNFAGRKGNMLSRNIVVQGTRFKYYSGTGIAFSNLGMRFTLFADYIEVLEEARVGSSDYGKINYTGTYKFKTPDEQLAELLPYSVGLYTKFLKDGSISNSLNSVVYSEEKDNKTTKEYTLKDVLTCIPFINESDLNKSSNEIEKNINTYLGWQMAPGGFRASIDYVDSIQTGTLMLKIGPYYRLKNLVVQDIQLNYSKHMAKYFDKETHTVKTCPLYCDVAITLSPANKYSDRMLQDFVMSRSRAVGNEHSSISDLEESINNNLNLNNYV